MGNPGKVTRRGILRKALVGLFLAGWLTGCSAQPVDMSLLTGDPCAPPCWQYITPGVTGQTEALARLMRSQFVKENSLSLVGVDEPVKGLGRLTYAVWKSAAGPWNKYARGTNYIYFRNDTVLWMEVYLEFELTAGQAVEKYGPPEGFSYNIAPDGGKYISLYYPHRGLSLEIFGPRLSLEEVERKTVKISEDLRISMAFYFVPDSAEGEVLVRGWAMQRPLIKWQGFGEYSLEP